MMSCYRPPKISVCDAYSQLVRVLSIFYPQVIHISGITYVNGVFTGFKGPSILHFFVEGLWKVILQDIVGMSFFLIYIVVIFFPQRANCGNVDESCRPGLLFYA